MTKAGVFGAAEKRDDEAERMAREKALRLLLDESEHVWRRKPGKDGVGSAVRKRAGKRISRTIAARRGAAVDRWFAELERRELAGRGVTGRLTALGREASIIDRWPAGNPWLRCPAIETLLPEYGESRTAIASMCRQGSIERREIPGGRRLAAGGLVRAYEYRLGPNAASVLARAREKAARRSGAGMADLIE